ncbi:glycosyltransferase family 9 protein, partial [Desulfosarcina sp. OttesenSCG-928-G17]|nr:glycosyltransferase family 9 protein [Desulfosarcina sp. OttesenSCG-928-G17]
MNILIVKLSAIGDVLHTLPALCAIRACYPRARITWVVETAAADLVKGHRALDRVIVFRRKEWIRQLASSHLKKGNIKAVAAEFLQFCRDLRDTRYDMVIDFQGLLKSSIPVVLAKSRRKIGFGRGMQHQEGSYLFLNERIAPVDMEIHALERGLILLSAIGISTDAIVYDVPVTDADQQAVNDLLVEAGIHGSRPLVAINPVALWETKLWKNDRFADLADRLVKEDNVDVVFTGGPDDRPVIADIISKMKSPAANLAGKTRLPMLAALYQKSRLLVTTDTGPMHLA